MGKSHLRENIAGQLQIVEREAANRDPDIVLYVVVPAAPRLAARAWAGVQPQFWELDHWFAPSQLEEGFLKVWELGGFFFESKGW